MDIKNLHNWKWKKESLFYKKDGETVICTLCPHGCKLKPGQFGICRARTNFQDSLWSIAYGNPCAIQIDPIEKKPLFHFYPGNKIFSIATAGCNLRCLNCQNWEISQVSPTETHNYELMPYNVIENCHEHKCSMIAYTYTEPIVYYEYMYDTALLAKEQGIKNVMVTAGYINQEPLEQLTKVIDAVNLDIKSFDDSIYHKLNGIRLEPVLNTLKTLVKAGVWVELTYLIIPKWNDSMDMIKNLCDWLVNNGFAGVPLHFSRFMPQYRLASLPMTSENTVLSAIEIARKSGITYVYAGNITGSAYENTYCPICEEKIIERVGFKVVANHIKKGKCKYCNCHIPGAFE